MYDREKAMTDAVNAISRMDFTQLITLNAQLSEHLFNCIQHSQIEQLRKKEATVLEEDQSLLPLD